MPEMDLGGGFGIAYTTQDDPADPASWRPRCTKIVEHECRALGVGRAAALDRAGPGDRRPGDVHGLQVGTVKQVALDGGARRTYVSVDGGMSDNIRTALYDADYSCTLASRALRRPRRCSARVVGKHCEAGDIVVRDEFLPGDVAPGDLLAVPGTGAYCRSMASNYNHVLRPPVIVGAGRESRASSCAGRPRTTCWRRMWVRLSRERESDKPLKVALLGCGSVGSQVVRLLLRAVRRPRRPGRAPRSSSPASPYAASTRRARSTCRPGCSPPTPLGLVDARRRRRRRRGDRRHRAGPVPDPGRARERRLASSPPTRRCSPRTARRFTRRPTRPAATSTTRPPSPARSRSCGRCASRWPATG